MLARLREDGVDDGVQMKELRGYMDSLPVQPEGNSTQNGHHPPPEGDQRGYIPEPLVGTPDPSELTWVQAAIANIKRWSCLTPMKVFRPPAHHRRLKLELADNASIPRSDPRGTAIGFRELDKTFVKGLLEQQRKEERQLAACWHGDWRAVQASGPQWNAGVATGVWYRSLFLNRTSWRGAYRRDKLARSRLHCDRRPALNEPTKCIELLVPSSAAP